MPSGSNPLEGDPDGVADGPELAAVGGGDDGGGDVAAGVGLGIGEP
jgi:hypothetical protein